MWPGFTELPGVKRFKFVQQPYSHLRAKFPAAPMGQRPPLSDKGFKMLERLLAYNPAKRLTAEDALAHPWFDEEPAPKDKALMPTFPSKADRKEAAKRKARRRGGPRRAFRCILPPPPAASAPSLQFLPVR